MKNAGALLRETHALLNVLEEMRAWVQPSNSPVCRNAGGPVKYVVTARAKLQSVHLDSFERTYPAISEAMANGTTNEASSPRLTDGIYKLGSFNMELEVAKFLLKTDAQRDTARGYLHAAIGDFAMFMAMQFGLDKTSTIYLSVDEYCTEQGITKQVLFGEIMGMLDNVNQHPYGYEELSPYYDDLMGIDPGFVAECEEAVFPLTEDICRDMISGKLTIEAARGLLLKHKQTAVETTVDDISPLNMIQKMHLG